MKDWNRDLRIGVIGAGFWSGFQIPAWGETDRASVVAITDADSRKAKGLAEKFGLKCFDSVDEMLRSGEIDVVDIITPPSTHSELVLKVADAGVAVIVQKPMAESGKEAKEMIRRCEQADVPLYVHENWRFQDPIQEVKRILDSGAIGRAFRAKVQFNCSFPVFQNQPALAQQERFIISDLGTHLIDACRMLFGDARTLLAHTQKIGDIAGEDVATLLIPMEKCDLVTCEMSYASRLPTESFPQTYICIEGTNGSITLDKDYWVTVLNSGGIEKLQITPTSYAWADPDYDLVHSGMVNCLRAILEDLRGGRPSGLRGTENLKTLTLVDIAYETKSFLKLSSEDYA